MSHHIHRKAFSSPPRLEKLVPFHRIPQFHWPPPSRLKPPGESVASLWSVVFVNVTALHKMLVLVYTWHTQYLVLNYRILLVWRVSGICEAWKFKPCGILYHEWTFQKDQHKTLLRFQELTILLPSIWWHGWLQPTHRWGSEMRSRSQLARNSRLAHDDLLWSCSGSWCITTVTWPPHWKWCHGLHGLGRFD